MDAAVESETAMTRIGIVGGIGPESTIAYYRLFVAAGHSAVTIHSVDVNRMLGFMMGQDYASATSYLVESVTALAQGGAALAIIAANTPHIVFDDVQAQSPIPLVSVVEATCRYVQAQGYRTVGLLGTKFTMEGTFYPAVFANSGVRLAVPVPDDLASVHDLYVKELLSNQLLDRSRARLGEIIGRMIAADGVEAVILGGTELPLLLTAASHADVPLLDTTRIHVEAALHRLLSHPAWAAVEEIRDE
jgi:aspartate racemase